MSDFFVYKVKFCKLEKVKIILCKHLAKLGKLDYIKC